jgi:hypothetical protein
MSPTDSGSFGRRTVRMREQHVAAVAGDEIDRGGLDRHGAPVGQDHFCIFWPARWRPQRLDHARTVVDGAEPDIGRPVAADDLRRQAEHDGACARM